MVRTSHLLVVDDDREIRHLLARYLTDNGYRVSTAEDGRSMDRALNTQRFDLIVLDLMLPGEDGLDLTRRLRIKSRIPIIMLTARGEETDRIVGLEMGADDYLPKPFNPRELLARIKTVLRRSDAHSSLARSERASKLKFAGWTLDLGRRQLTSPDNVIVTLTSGEFDLLVALAEHPQRVMNRERLLDLTRGRNAAPFDRSVDVQVGRLRRKIEVDPADPQLIKTVRGGGYVLATTVERLE